MRSEFSAPLSQKRLGFSIQAPEKVGPVSPNASYELRSTPFKRGVEETGHAPHLDHHLWSRSKRVDNLSLLYDDGLVAALRVLAVQHPELRRLRKVPYYVVSHITRHTTLRTTRESLMKKRKGTHLLGVLRPQALHDGAGR